jgi:cell envelope opacity-associated protein A
MTDWTNYGIGGVGNPNAENLAVGTNSRVEQSNWPDSIAGQLADLQSAIDAFQGPPATREALMKAHVEILEELRAPVPDKHKIHAKLTFLGQLAGPAATVVQAAAALAQMITTIH